KRIDLLLETVARVHPLNGFRLLILAGEPFAPFSEQVQQLGLTECVIIREKVTNIEDYLQVADIGLFTSETESFCLSILEAMCFGCPSVSTHVGGIPEVIDHHETGHLVPFGDADGLARAVEDMIENPSRRQAMGRAAKSVAAERFSAD